MPDRPTVGTLEQRALAPEAEPIRVDGRRLRGVIPYAVESRDLGGWRERIEPGALADADLSALVATVHHDASRILGRHPTTLQVEDRADGFHWSCDLPTGPTGEDVRVAVERGDIRASSWRMVVAAGGEEWRGDVRHVHKIAALRDVCVTATPAYGDEARAEYRSAPTPHLPPRDAAPTPEKEPIVPDEPTTTPTAPGGLRVEDRTAAPAGTPESRILDAIASVPPGEMRDLTHATAAPVEPDDLRTVLIDRLRSTSVVAASGVPIVPTDKKAVKFPMLTGDVNVAFYDELEEITPSDPGLDEFDVAVKALKALVRCSTEAVEDSEPDLLQLLSDHLNIAMALKGDRELVAGNDPKGFPGLMNVTGTQAIAVNGALSWDHVIKAVGLLVEANVPGPYAVLLGPRTATALDLTKETAGSAKYVGRPDGIPPVYSTGWLPVTAGATPKTSAVVYAPGQEMIVVRRSVTVEIDRSQEFSRDAILARGRYRLGLGVPHPASIVKLTGIDAPAIA